MNVSPLQTVYAIVKTGVPTVTDTLTHLKMRNQLLTDAFDLVIVEVFSTEALLSHLAHLSGRII